MVKFPAFNKTMPARSKVSGSVVAGFPSPAEQYLEPPLDLNELLVKRPAATYFVRVEGDSMIGAGISDGDLLVVDRSLRPADGDVIIASVDGDFTETGRLLRRMCFAQNNNIIELIERVCHSIMQSETPK